MIKIRYRFLSLLAALLLFVTSFLSFSGNSTSVNALSLGAANYDQVDVTDGEIIPDIGQNAMSIHRMDGARISWYTVDGPSDAYNVWYDAFGDSNSAFDGTPTSLVITFTRESALDEIDGITVSSQQTDEAKIYDLSGRAVENTDSRKGVYIIRANGKARKILK